MPPVLRKYNYWFRNIKTTGIVCPEKPGEMLMGKSRGINARARPKFQIEQRADLGRQGPGGV